MAVDRDRSKASLDTLDWLRGIAAVCVMGFHYFQHGPLQFLLPRASLAVDFFFMLSGFVLAYRYGSDIPRSFGAVKFIGARVLRLYPLYIVGALLGGAVLAIGIEFGRTPGFSLKEGGISGLLAVLFQPYLGHFALEIGTGHIDAPAFPLNIPAWSLFFELVANVIMAIMLLSYRRLLAIIVPALVLLCLADYSYGDTNIGWGYAGFFGGFPRVMFGFFVGVLLERVHRDGRITLPRFDPHLIAGLLALDLCLPNVAHLRVPLYLVSITILFPALILAGAQASPHPGKGSILSLLGRISYALYMVHYPILMIADLVVREAGIPLTGWSQAVVTGVSAGAALALAAALTLWFDEPLRRWVMRRPARTTYRPPRAPPLAS